MMSHRRFCSSDSVERPQREAAERDRDQERERERTFSCESVSLDHQEPCPEQSVILQQGVTCILSLPAPFCHIASTIICRVPGKPVCWLSNRETHKDPRHVHHASLLLLRLLLAKTSLDNIDDCYQTQAILELGQCILRRRQQRCRLCREPDPLKTPERIGADFPLQWISGRAFHHYIRTTNSQYPSNTEVASFDLRRCIYFDCGRSRDPGFDDPWRTDCGWFGLFCIPKCVYPWPVSNKKPRTCALGWFEFACERGHISKT